MLRVVEQLWHLRVNLCERNVHEHYWYFTHRPEVRLVTLGFQVGRCRLLYKRRERGWGRHWRRG